MNKAKELKQRIEERVKIAETLSTIELSEQVVDLAAKRRKHSHEARKLQTEYENQAALLKGEVTTINGYYKLAKGRATSLSIIEHEETKS